MREGLPDQPPWGGYGYGSEVDRGGFAPHGRFSKCHRIVHIKVILCYVNFTSIKKQKSGPPPVLCMAENLRR